MGKNYSVYLNDKDATLFDSLNQSPSDFFASALKAYDSDCYQVEFNYKRSASLVASLLAQGKKVKQYMKVLTYQALSQEVIDYAIKHDLFSTKSAPKVIDGKYFFVFSDRAILNLGELQIDLDNETSLVLDLINCAKLQYEKLEAEKQSRIDAKVKADAELKAKYAASDAAWEAEKAATKAKEDANNEAIRAHLVKNCGNLDFVTIAKSDKYKDFLHEIVEFYLASSLKAVTMSVQIYNDDEEIKLSDVEIKRAAKLIALRDNLTSQINALDLVTVEHASFYNDAVEIGVGFNDTIYYFTWKL